MSESIDGDISQKYLDDVYRDVRKALDNNKLRIGTRRPKLDLIAKELGFKNFQFFENEILKPVDPILRNCIGNWWSIVRANVGKDLFKAPVRIYEDSQQGICIKLKGQENRFRGKIELRAGCLFCELDSSRDKKIYIVIKSSVSEGSRILQGTFAGISSTGDPIGGRELFLREKDQSFEDMKWEKLPVNSKTLDKRISAYFENAEGNCIKIDNRSDLE